MVPSSAWLSALGRYLVVLAAGNLAWEFAQMPLYTLWSPGSAREIVFAAVHCAGGDVLPGLGTRLAPVAQWLVVPLLALAASGLPSTSQNRAIERANGLDLSIMGITTSRSTPANLARRNRRAS